MEFNPFVIHNPDDMTRNISLRDLSEFLQMFCLDDKIALFSDYAQNNDSATIDESDVFEQLRCTSENRKAIGNWREYHQTQRIDFLAKWNQAALEAQTRKENESAVEARRARR